MTDKSINKLRWFARGMVAVGAIVHVALAHAGGPAAGTDSRSAAAAQDSTDQIIVRYRDNVRGKGASVTTSLSAERVREASGRRGFQARQLRVTASGAQVWAMGRMMSIGEARAVAADIAAADSDVEYAEPDSRAMPLGVPNDPSFYDQWNYYESLAGINVLPAWERVRGLGVEVAVIDTGHTGHSDLWENLHESVDLITNVWTANDGNGRDGNGEDPGDAVAAGECAARPNGAASTWHGTHVAGTIGAVTDNGVGVAGIANGATLYSVRVLGRCGGYVSDIADGILYAVGSSVPGISYVRPRPARVLNLSIGGGGACAATYVNAINTARSRGAVVVVAAGNDNVDVSQSQPANCPGVIAVAAVNRSGGKASFSNYGAGVTIAAPGEGILSTLNAGVTTPGAQSYAWYSGTSMAAPHVAGVAALMFAAKPSLSPDQVAAILRSTARPFPAPCSGCGSGIVDAGAAVQAVATPLTTLTLTGPDDAWWYESTPIVARIAGNNPTGTVTFYKVGDTTPVAVTAQVVGGVASTTVWWMQFGSGGGTFRYSASYSGDANNGISQAGIRVIEVHGD
jgi:serine protease